MYFSFFIALVYNDVTNFLAQWNGMGKMSSRPCPETPSHVKSVFLSFRQINANGLILGMAGSSDRRITSYKQPAEKTLCVDQGSCVNKSFFYLNCWDLLVSMHCCTLQLVFNSCQVSTWVILILLVDLPCSSSI